MASGSFSPMDHGLDSPLTTTPSPTNEIYSYTQAGGAVMASILDYVKEVLALGTAKLKQVARLVSAFSTATGTTPLQVTDLTFGSAAGTFSLLAGQAYEFIARLDISPDATGGHKYAMGGTATATAVWYDILSIRRDTAAIVICSKQTALAGAAGAAGSTAVITTIQGSILVNAAGTFGPQFSRNAASGTSSVGAGSTFHIWPV